VRGDADGGGAAGGRTSGGGEDGYERALPSHGDEFAHKLISAVQKNPGQILRQEICWNGRRQVGLIVFLQMDEVHLRRFSYGQKL
jgi:hypothetical protein